MMINLKTSSTMVLMNLFVT